MIDKTLVMESGLWWSIGEVNGSVVGEQMGSNKLVLILIFSIFLSTFFS